MTEQETPDDDAPHPVLASYYEKRAQQKGFVRTLFNETAPYYDRINQLFSLGSGRWYRRECLKRAGLRPGLKMLDVAVGTGLVAREAVRIVDDERSVIGLDLSEAMLAETRRKLHIPLVQGTAEQLPVADVSVDFVSMGYALRHVSDLGRTFHEFHRVLRPAGTLLLLEISRPEARLTRALVSNYLGRWVPFASRLTTGQARTQTLMEYYWDTIENCVPYPVILAAMRDSGFTDVRCEATFGFFRSYIGRKS